MNGADPAEEFTSLFACHRNRIFRYIRALVPHLTDAEDVFQETSVVLWREFPSYRRDAAFLPWALAIAFNRVRTHRHRRRQARLYFGEALIDMLAAESEALSGDLDARSEALRGCREKLRPGDRDLIDSCHAGDASVGDLAGEGGVS